MSVHTRLYVCVVYTCVFVYCVSYTCVIHTCTYMTLSSLHITSPCWHPHCRSHSVGSLLAASVTVRSLAPSPPRLLPCSVLGSTEGALGVAPLCWWEGCPLKAPFCFTLGSSVARSPWLADTAQACTLLGLGWWQTSLTLTGHQRDPQADRSVPRGWLGGACHHEAQLPIHLSGSACGAVELGGPASVSLGGNCGQTLGVPRVPV